MGIELDHKIQDPSELAEKGVVVCDHNGEHRGTFYFKCRPRCGIFCHPDKVEWIPPEYSEVRLGFFLIFFLIFFFFFFLSGF